MKKSIHFLEPEDERLAHHLDDIIFMAEESRNDTFLKSLLWPRNAINAFRIRRIMRQNVDILHNYKHGIKISALFISLFTIVQAAALSFMAIPFFYLLQFLFHWRIADNDSFLFKNIYSLSLTGTLLTILLFFLYSHSYNSCIRLTPTFFEYVHQRKELREFQLNEKLRLLQESVRLNEEKQQMFLDVIAQAYNAALVIQANRSSFGKDGEDLMELMASLLQKLDPNVHSITNDIETKATYKYPNQILDDPFE